MTVTAGDSDEKAVTLERFDPSWPELFVDPYPIFTKYREVEPVHWGYATNPQLPGSWYTFRFDECEAALADQRLRSDPASVGMADVVPPAFEPVAHVFLEWLGALDAPKHSRIRSVMSKAFTPRRVAAFRPRMEAIAEELIQTATERGGPVRHRDVLCLSPSHADHRRHAGRAPGRPRAISRTVDHLRRCH